MLERTDFHDRVDKESRKILRDQPEHAGDVAILGAAVKSMLKREWSSITGNGHVRTASQLLDVCGRIDTHPQWEPKPELLPAVEKARSHAAFKLMQLLYERKIVAEPEKQMELREEQQLVTMVARWLPAWRKILPQEGMIGPGWMSEHCPSPLWQRIQWYVHDWDTGLDEWERFMELLPADIRKSFSPQLIPLVLPKKLGSPEEAIALVKHLSMETGLSVNQILLPEHCKRLCKTHRKAYVLLIRYGIGRIPNKHALHADAESDDADANA